MHIRDLYLIVYVFGRYLAGIVFPQYETYVGITYLGWILPVSSLLKSLCVISFWLANTTNRPDMEDPGAVSVRVGRITSLSMQGSLGTQTGSHRSNNSYLCL